MVSRAKIALLTCAQYPELFEDEHALLARLASRDIDARAVIWNNPNVDWRSFDRVVLRNTWDYFERMVEFLPWLDQMEREQVELRNSIPLIRWNMDKFYLRELEGKGVRIVPTLFLDKGSAVDLAECIEERRFGEAILKPAVSGGAYRTHRIPAGAGRDFQSHAEVILKECGALVQPFISEVVSEGEWSFLFFGGVFSHAVLKTPAQGDFRVQPQFGARTVQMSPSPELIAEARRSLDLLPFPALYARIDGVRVKGELQLMEVEVIEPYLFTAELPAAQDRFVDCLVADLAQGVPASLSPSP